MAEKAEQLTVRLLRTAPHEDGDHMVTLQIPIVTAAHALSFVAEEDRSLGRAGEIEAAAPFQESPILAVSWMVGACTGARTGNMVVQVVRDSLSSMPLPNGDGRATSAGALMLSLMLENPCL
jgi:hypothetical protein